MGKINSVLEESIRLHAQNFGPQKAHELAASAGVVVTEHGQVVRINGIPFVVLCRLTRLFTLHGKLASAESCKPLLAEMQKLAAQPEYAEIAVLSKPFGFSEDSSRLGQHQLEAGVKS